MDVGIPREFADWEQKLIDRNAEIDRMSAAVRASSRASGAGVAPAAAAAAGPVSARHHAPSHAVEPSLLANDIFSGGDEYGGASGGVGEDTAFLAELRRSAGVADEVEGGSAAVVATAPSRAAARSTSSAQALTPQQSRIPKPKLHRPVSPVRPVCGRDGLNALHLPTCVRLSSCRWTARRARGPPCRESAR
jgi:hypothetical protein